MTAGPTIDHHFARFMARLAKTDDPAIYSLFGEVARALTTQHSCIDLNDHDDIDRAALMALDVVGGASDKTPLVLEGHRLYLRRYFQYETEIANRLAAMNLPLGGVDEARVKDALSDQFDKPGQQKLAAFQALTRQLTVVAGGPGTGKTTTVSAILRAARLLEGDDLPVALAAPTGKAAMRLQAGLAGVPELPQVKTLHRLLGFRPDTGTWRHDAESPLPAALVIVDEVSMIDLAMMHRLLQALSSQTRLLLLGDPGQLPSVEAGNLLADISADGFPYSQEFADAAERIAGVHVDPEPNRHLLQDALCELKESHRFSPDRGIGKLSASIRRGEAALDQDDEVETRPLPDLDETCLETIFGDFFEAIERGDSTAALAGIFDRTRILSPVRDGDFGVKSLNEAIESLLRQRGLADDAEFYHGRPVLVTRNDYTLSLYNGDIGICVTHGVEKPRVVFPGADKPREFLASRLPAHETCFAMTVHKSQGSEFDHVVLVLPPPATASQAKLLTREMLYTAITRARSRVSLFYDEQALATSLAQHTYRHSGLGDRLRLANPPATQPALEQQSKSDDNNEDEGQMKLF